MLTDGRYGECARCFAERYAAFDPARQRRAMLRRMEKMMQRDQVEESDAEPALAAG